MSGVGAPSRGKPLYTLERLSNGARLIVCPMAARTSVSVSFGFSVGSRYEDERSAGLAHFIEHIVFKGSRDFPTARHISEAIEGVGGVLNASTDREDTVFWARVPSRHLRLAATVLADMLIRPRVEQAEVTKERRVVIEELRMYADNPQDYAQQLFDDVMWPDHPLGRDVAGSEQTVASFKSADCRGILDRMYRPERLVITVAGDVAPDEPRGLFEELLADWAPGEAVSPPRSAGSVAGHELRVGDRPTEQANILVGARGPSYSDEDRHAVDILNGILGDGMSSRLFLEVRERQGLAYDVHSFSVKLADTGAFGMSIGCEPARALRAVESAIGQLTALAERPPTDEEVVRAKEYGKGRLQLHLESTSGLGSYFGEQELLTGTILDPEALTACLEAVGPRDVQRVAAAVLENGLRGAVVGPVPKAERLAAALERATEK